MRHFDLCGRLVLKNLQQLIDVDAFVLVFLQEFADNGLNFVGIAGTDRRGFLEHDVMDYGLL